MIYVVDSTLVITWLFGSTDNPKFIAADRFLSTGDRFIAPAALIHEVLGRIASKRSGGVITSVQASEASSLFAQLGIDIQPFPTDYSSVPRLMELGTNLGMADATFVLLGEEVGAPVITLDSKLIDAAPIVTDHEVRAP
jgi:predicted nucleic acid-binding protein